MHHLFPLKSSVISNSLSWRITLTNPHCFLLDSYRKMSQGLLLGWGSEELPRSLSILKWTNDIKRAKFAEFMETLSFPFYISYRLVAHLWFVFIRSSPFREVQKTSWFCRIDVKDLGYAVEKFDAYLISLMCVAIFMNIRSDLFKVHYSKPSSFIQFIHIYKLIIQLQVFSVMITLKACQRKFEFVHRVPPPRTYWEVIRLISPMHKKGFVVSVDLAIFEWSFV